MPLGAAGAEDLRLTTAAQIREAEVEGSPMFIEATITATASGRPRVAHPREAAASSV